MFKRNKNFTSIIVGIILLVFCLLEAKTKGDFHIFIDASKDLILKKNIYTSTYSEWYHYFYDLNFALILVPFTFLPIYLVKVIWLIANLFFLYRTWIIMTSYLDFSSYTVKQKNLFTLIVFLFMFRFIKDNFHVTQVTIFVLYTIFEGYHLIQRKKIVFGSLLLVIGISLKLLPIVIIPYLIYRKEFKAFIITIFLLAIYQFIPILFLGADYTFQMLPARWELINPNQKAHILDTSERSFHSLTTLLATLFVKETGDTHALTLRRHLFEISTQQLTYVIQTVRIILIAFTLYFLQTRPFKAIKNPNHYLAEMAYICLIIPLIFPHQQHYSFYFIFPAITYIIYAQFESFQLTRSVSKSRRSLIVGLVIAYLLLNLHLLLGTFNEYYDHFKIVTYGVLLVLVIHAITFQKFHANEQR
jgi:hypothetical protein